MTDANRKLQVFLSYGPYNTPTAYYLYNRLLDEDWIEPWLAEVKLLPGQDRELELKAMIESTDVALVCLSKQSLNQEGHFQREITLLTNVAGEKIRGSIFIIPVLLDNCVSEIPESLSHLRPVYFDLESNRREQSYELILRSLKRKFDIVSGKTIENRTNHWVSPPQPSTST